MASDVFEIFPQLLNPAAHEPAVGLYLRFARPPGADAAAQPLQVSPLTGKARQQVLVLSEFDLQTALLGARPGREYVQYQRGAVYDLRLHAVAMRGDGQRILQIALLCGRKLVVADDGGGLELGALRLYLLELALAHVLLRRAIQALGYSRDDPGARRPGKLGKLVERILRMP